MPRVTGVEYKSRIPSILVELSKQTKLANKDLADAIAAGAKDRVPTRTGKLQQAIHVEFKGDDDWDVVAGDRDAFYGHMVEFGTTRAPAHPFLVPAAEAMIPQIPTHYRRRLGRLGGGRVR